MKSLANLIKTRVAILVLFLAVPLFSAAVFPPDGFMPGWKSKGQVREFTRNGLYGHINGGSELFLEFGFIVLRLQKYQAPGDSDEISIETYRMESPEAALGIYLMKCGSETPVPGIHDQVRQTGDRYQITLLKGCYFITVNNFSGNPAYIPVMVKMANQTLDQFPATQPADLFSLLPGENRVPGTELLFRGPFSLQAIYTLGEGDLLLLENKIFGVTAQYRYPHPGTEPGKKEETYNYLAVRYPDKTTAKEAFSYLKANLDPYIQVLTNHNHRFTFKDYQGKYGQVSLKEDQLQLRVNLPEPVRTFLKKGSDTSKNL
jgi:hypothetical protein